MGYKSTVDTMLYFANERWKDAKEAENSLRDRVNELERVGQLAECLDGILTNNTVTIRVMGGKTSVYLTCNSDCEIDLVKKLLLNAISKVVPNISGF